VSLPNPGPGSGLALARVANDPHSPLGPRQHRHSTPSLKHMSLQPTHSGHSEFKSFQRKQFGCLAGFLLLQVARAKPELRRGDYCATRSVLRPVARRGRQNGRRPRAQTDLRPCSISKLYVDECETSFGSHTHFCRTRTGRAPPPRARLTGCQGDSEACRDRSTISTAGNV
jgi:hypothetical protein